jgi:two-component system, OmpR family, alkaline phosphatase synthesis response regulator PhoP
MTVPPFEKILVVEDERHLAKTLLLSLKQIGLSGLQHVSTLKAALEYLKTDTPDLVLLDRMLPDGEGLSLLKEFEQLDPRPLVLVLSARGESSERVEGLREGADDYLPKPFDMAELEARVLALGRRLKKNPPLQTWSCDPNSLKILSPKGWINVTQLEYKLLEKFISQPGVAMSREDLLKDVWGFQWLPKTRTVDFFMSRIRKSFEKDPDTPRHFITVRGVGYRFDP